MPHLDVFRFLDFFMESDIRLIWVNDLPLTSRAAFLTQREKDRQFSALSQEPVDQELVWKKYTFEFVDWGNQDADEYIIYLHGLVGNSRIFERQMRSKELSSFRHIWLDFYNWAYIRDRRKWRNGETKEQNPAQISADYLNEFLIGLWIEGKRLHFVGASLWGQVLLHYASQHSGFVDSLTFAGSSWIAQEKIDLGMKEGHLFFTLQKDVWRQIKMLLEWFSKPEFVREDLYEKWFRKYFWSDWRMFLMTYVVPFTEITVNSPDFEGNREKLEKIASLGLSVSLLRWDQDQITSPNQLPEREEILWNSLKRKYVAEWAGHWVYVDDYEWSTKHLHGFFTSLEK